MTLNPLSVLCCLSSVLWPRPQRHLGDLVQVLAARAAGRLHRHAFEHCHDVARIVGRIELARNLACADRALEPLAQHRLAGGATRHELIADLVRSLATSERAA